MLLVVAHEVDVEVVDVVVEVLDQAGTLTCEFFIFVYFSFFSVHPDSCPDPNYFRGVSDPGPFLLLLLLFFKLLYIIILEFVLFVLETPVL